MIGEPQIDPYYVAKACGWTVHDADESTEYRHVRTDTGNIIPFVMLCHGPVMMVSVLNALPKPMSLYSLEGNWVAQHDPPDMTHSFRGMASTPHEAVYDLATAWGERMEKNDA